MREALQTTLAKESINQGGYFWVDVFFLAICILFDLIGKPNWFYYRVSLGKQMPVAWKEIVGAAVISWARPIGDGGGCVIPRMVQQIVQAGRALDVVLQELLVGLVRLKPFQARAGEHLGDVSLAVGAAGHVTSQSSTVSTWLAGRAASWSR